MGKHCIALLKNKVERQKDPQEYSALGHSTITLTTLQYEGQNEIDLGELGGLHDEVYLHRARGILRGARGSVSLPQGVLRRHGRLGVHVKLSNLLFVLAHHLGSLQLHRGACGDKTA